MTAEQITKANAELRDQIAARNLSWAIAQAKGRAIVSTNFRPYEAVILHLARRCSRTFRCCGWTTATIVPRLTGTPRQLKKLLKLNLKAVSAENDRRASRRAFGGMSDPPKTRPDQGVQRADEAGAVPARHEGTRANGLAHRVAQGAESEPRRTWTS